LSSLPVGPIGFAIQFLPHIDPKPLWLQSADSDCRVISEIQSRWRPTLPTKTDQIRALNDELRQHLLGGIAVITPGVAALGQEAVERIVKTIAVYDDFCHANDPHEEHDFGAFDADGHRIFFKIDYYDKTLTHHSPDPSDPSVTERVITIMLADEY
jgi:hypothetical protein